MALSCGSDLGDGAGSTRMAASGSSPQYWWDWWYRYSDFQPGDKHIVRTETYQAPTFVPIQIGSLTSGCSCFVAGTPVVTKSGVRSIEKLRIGDRVLSQDSETGELGFRVVLRTTTRPPTQTIEVTFGSETIQCTGRHHFWKVGAGWLKARDLKPGDHIRTPTGTAAVSKVEEGGARTTHNLVVEGFHTYFVGESELLVQDVVPLHATDMVSPGLSRFDLK